MPSLLSFATSFIVNSRHFNAPNIWELCVLSMTTDILCYVHILYEVIRPCNACIFGIFNSLNDCSLLTAHKFCQNVFVIRTYKLRTHRRACFFVSIRFSPSNPNRTFYQWMFVMQRQNLLCINNNILLLSYVQMSS